MGVLIVEDELSLAESIRDGLCQTSANEMWHFELATTPGGECPAQLSDASAG